jgi:hypothetical protein
MEPSLRASTHQWQDNIIKAQKYIYEESPQINNMIIGSSLSRRLNMDNLPDFANLSFNGLSIFDGLNILKHKELSTKNVFIETNFVLRNGNDNFDKTLFGPVLFTLRKYLLSLRDDRQPIPIVISGLYNCESRIIESVNLLKYLIKDGIKMMLGPLANSLKKKPSETNLKKDELFNKLLKYQIDYYSKKPDNKLIEEKFALLLENVEFLKKRNVNVIFFEMPTNNSLRELPLSSIVRNKFHQYFPKEAYQYIEVPKGSYCLTGDGIHLARDEAIEYTLYFKAQVNRMSMTNRFHNN